MVPVPLPSLVTVSVNELSVNVAVTFWAVSIVVTQGAVPKHPPPDHPEKYEPAFGVAVKVTGVPQPRSELQSDPQSIPTAELATLPLPFPVFITFNR